MPSVPWTTERPVLWNALDYGIISFQESTCSVANGTPKIMEQGSRNPPSERDLLNFARDFLRKRLPGGWSQEVRTERGRTDALWTLSTPDGRVRQIDCEAKSIVNTRDVPVLVQQRATTGSTDAQPTLVITRYLS